jgi:hypothetical protein
MKFPTKNTCAFAILELIYNGGMKTKGQIIRHFHDRFVRDTTTEKIEELLNNGQLLMEKHGLTISVLVRRHFEQCEVDMLPAKPVTTTVASPRTVKPFTPMTGYKLNRDGTRPGAADHRNWKSRHLPE